eukprot:6465939-Amphidinium_carterae.1
MSSYAEASKGASGALKGLVSPLAHGLGQRPVTVLRMPKEECYVVAEQSSKPSVKVRQKLHQHLEGIDNDRITLIT